MADLSNAAARRLTKKPGARMPGPAWKSPKKRPIKIQPGNAPKVPDGQYEYPKRKRNPALEDGSRTDWKLRRARLIPTKPRPVKPRLGEKLIPPSQQEVDEKRRNSLKWKAKTLPFKGNLRPPEEFM